MRISLRIVSGAGVALGVALAAIAARDANGVLSDGHHMTHHTAYVSSAGDDAHIVVASADPVENAGYAGSMARVNAYDRDGNVAVAGFNLTSMFATSLIALAATGATDSTTPQTKATVYPQVTCTGGGTCEDSTSCNHPSLCTLFFSTCLSTFTCAGGPTCTQITCLDFTCSTTNTCKGSTCSGTTCTSSVTCSGSPTCNGYTTCSTTCDGTPTCNWGACHTKDQQYDDEYEYWDQY